MTAVLTAGPLAFDLPPALEAREPPEARGLERDEVKLLVASGSAICHRTFRDLPDVLEPGDVLVVNTSATLAAALTARRADGDAVELHLSTQLPGGLWVVEPRRTEAHAGETLELPNGGRAELLSPYPVDGGGRLWVSALHLPGPLVPYLETHGRPIRYGYVDRAWPLAAYQTVFAVEPGSAEMPSAARPFTAELVAALVSRSIAIAPIVLHTGVSSLEDHEPPFAEAYRVPPTTARLVNGARRVIAVGTTVVRALETVADATGEVHPGEGWTELVITPERGVRAVDGLITGWHEPKASHLLMLEAIAGRDLLERSYQAALDAGYLWHEFGDSHLLLP